MQTYLTSVQQRVALRDAERYISYVLQDLKSGHHVSAQVYAQAAIRTLQSLKGV